VTLQAYTLYAYNFNTTQWSRNTTQWSRNPKKYLEADSPALNSMNNRLRLDFFPLFIMNIHVYLF